MKKLLVVVLVVAIALLGATAAMAAVYGSKHDLSNDATAGRTYYSSGAGVQTSETCVFCHTAHGSNSAMDPIWNRPAGTNAFVAYGTTMAGTATMAALNGSTQLCLSCHDGSTAMNVLFNNPGSGNTALDATTLGAITGVANLTADMTNDHPIGIVYTVGVGGAKAVAGASPTPGIVKINAVNSVQATSGTDEVHCSSCHDVHNMTAGSAMLMPIAGGNAGSQLCITCHDR